MLEGVRLWSIRATVQVQSLLQVQTKDTFADPIVAVRWRHQVPPR